MAIQMVTGLPFPVAGFGVGNEREKILSDTAVAKAADSLSGRSRWVRGEISKPRAVKSAVTHPTPLIGVKRGEAIKALKKASSDGVEKIAKKAMAQLPSVDLKTVKKALHVTATVYIGLESMKGVVSNVLEAVSGFFQASRLVNDIYEGLSPVLKYADLVSIGLAPIFLAELGIAIYEFVTDKIDLAEFIPKVVAYTLELIDTITSFLSTLDDIGVLDVVPFLNIFALAGIFSSIHYIVMNSLDWYETSKFSKEFEYVLSEGRSEEAIKGMLAFMKHAGANDLSKSLNVDGNVLIERINDIGTRTLNNQAEEKEWDNAIELLRGRIKNKIISHKLSITSNSVSLVAKTVLFATSYVLPVCPALAPIVPVMYALKAASGSIGVANLIFKGVTDYKFNHSDLMKGKERVEPNAEVDTEPTAA